MVSLSRRRAHSRHNPPATPGLFHELEAAALLPLPSQPFERVTWARGKVAKDCHVQVLGSLYSIPYEHWGKNVDARASEKVVEFYLEHQLVKTHSRVPKGRRQTDWNDYPPEKAAFYQRTPDWCQSRADLLGPHVARAVAELLAKHKLHSLRQCQGIVGLAKKYDRERVNAACQRALAFSDGAYKTIANILERGLDKQLALPLNSPKANSAGAHLHGPQQLFNSIKPNEDGENRTNG